MNSIAALVLASILLSASANTRELPNGFSVQAPLIDADEIRPGGPPRDGIPALTDPKFIRASKAWIEPGDKIIGVFRNGVAKAYPVRILDWHEIVNDAVGGDRIVVTYCPLCGSGMVFHAFTKGRRRTFGVSGLLYNSDVLLYDKQTESLWSQLMKKAVSGPLKGTSLRQLPARHTTWKEWTEIFPSSLIMARETGWEGLRRNYSKSPYQGYEDSPQLFFPIGYRDGRLPIKEWVLGVEILGHAKAYPIRHCPADEFEDTINGKNINIYCNKLTKTAFIRDARGREIPTTAAYWFAWAAFHPKTEIYKISKLKTKNSRRSRR